jgi:hypothetical protein
MITLNELIAEIETTFQNLTETGDIDRLSIKDWVIGCLRQLGKNICDQREGFVEIKNSQGNLPETFKSLILALKLKPEGCQILGDKSKAEKSYIYKQRIEQPGYFDWVTNEFVTNCKTKIVTEKVIMDTEAAEFYYTPEMLSVVKGFKKDSFDVDCININSSLRQAHHSQININGRTVQTNFRENCRLYIQYNSLPMQNGEIAIPSITTEDIYKWIINTIKIRIVENLIINNKNPTPGLQSMLQLWLQQDRQLFLAAKSESNWSGLSKNWNKLYKKRLEIEASYFNLPKR